MRSAIFDAIPDWVELAILLFFLPFLAPAAMKQRGKLRGVADSAAATEDEKKSATKRLRAHVVLTPLFAVIYVSLIVAATAQVIKL